MCEEIFLERDINNTSRRKIPRIGAVAGAPRKFNHCFCVEKAFEFDFHAHFIRAIFQNFLCSKKQHIKVAFLLIIILKFMAL